MAARISIIIIFSLMIAGCGAFHSQETNEERAAFSPGKTPPAKTTINLHASIAEPNIPADLTAKAKGLGSGSASNGKLYSYTVEVQSEKKELSEAFEKLSRISQMKDEAASMTTLEQRLNVSLEEGQDILRSYAYYEGSVEGRIETLADDKVKIKIIFVHGPRYKIGASKIIVNPPLLNKDKSIKAPPKTLDDVGLKKGEKALASDVLTAVERVKDSFRNNGYPRASIEGSRYVIDRNKKTLEAEIFIIAKDFARMGEVIKPENSSVDQSYLNALRPWKIGQVWNQSLLDDYLISLRQTGLFQKVEAFPSREETDEGVREVRLRLSKAPEKTVGGMLSYDTDFGPGVTAYWEHRNLTGHGDRLRLNMPVWKDLQEFTASYRYPYFLRPDQDIIAQGGILHQDSDAYELSSGAASVGIERRISRRWQASVSGSVEGGKLTDPGEKSKEFIMFGLPTTATYNSTNSLLDPTKGYRLILYAAPYTGTFREDFNVVKTKVEGHAFIPLGSDKLVLASRLSWGSVWGADDSQDVPNSLRFYSGGGGSVRGYNYQSVGPRNEKRDPLGGVSQVEANVETRWRFSENMGLVAFVDGGMVYEDVADQLFQDMLWGAGLGFRYYTPIGPARVDVAVPLDKRPDDDSWQLYLSLGQSF